jgi:hypothetical protein
MVRIRRSHETARANVAPEFRNKLEQYWNNGDAPERSLEQEKARLSGPFLA